MNIKRVREEFTRFHTGIKKLSSLYEVAEEIENGYIISPPSERENMGISLTLMAITHGDEAAGLAVLNEVIEFLLNGFPLKSTLALVLGNYPAALQEKRFLERDLNRSFAADDTTLEVARAKQLSKILLQTRFFIDFHQTHEKNAYCFSIFPFTPKNLSFAQIVNKQQPVVTRFGGSFSAEGMCSDEFAMQNGSTAITIELGKKGFDTYQIAQGALIAFRALYFINNGSQLSSSMQQAPVYTFAQVVPYPDSGDYQLDEGFYNFKAVATGERLGLVEGKVVCSEVDGFVLFPKYKVDKKKPPHELCHILKKISSVELYGK